MGVHLNCGVYVEELLSACGPIRRTIKYEKARVSLVKSDNSGLIIRIKPSDGLRKCIGYKVSNPKLFTRFVREGKSTISLKSVPVNIMLRNCPPDTLQLFLYNVKVLCDRLKGHGVRRSVFGKNTSLSLLDEVLPMRNGSASESVTSPKANLFPEPGLSPINVGYFPFTLFKLLSLTYFSRRNGVTRAQHVLRPVYVVLLRFTAQNGMRSWQREFPHLALIWTRPFRMYY